MFCMHINSCSATEYVLEDWSAEVKQENLATVKQEPDDVCCVLFCIPLITLVRIIQLFN